MGKFLDKPTARTACSRRTIRKHPAASTHAVESSTDLAIAETSVHEPGPAIDARIGYAGRTTKPNDAGMAGNLLLLLLGKIILRTVALHVLQRRSTQGIYP